MRVAGALIEQRLRALDGVLACSVQGRRAHVLCGPQDDRAALRRAAREAAPGYRVTVLHPGTRHHGPVGTIVAEVVPVLAAAGLAVGAAGLGAYALSQVLTPDRPAPAPGVAVELPPPPSGRTVVPAPAEETHVLGEVTEAPEEEDARFAPP